MKKDNKKTKKERRILVAALLVAAVTIAGSTFAWFSSQDEVTNRLSATADYGVTITEDFTPPEDWTPGQIIKKEAAAINTGNVDAFVRMWLTGDMKLVKAGTGIVYSNFPTAASLSTVNEAPYTALKLTKKDNNNNYYRVLTDAERKSLQTGELAYAAAAYTYTKNQLDDGLDYGNGTAYTNGQGAVKLVDSDSFTPSAAGLFLFRRNYDLNATTGNVDPATAQFSGYYFDGTDYYALDTANNGTIPGGVSGAGKNVCISELAGKSGAAFDTALATVKVFTATDNIIDNSELTWTYTTPANASDSPFNSTNPYFVVTETAATNSTLKINIELANIGDGSAADKWEPIGTDNATTFYYTDDVKAGETTNILVKNVQLDNGVSQEDFMAFDFDLNVNLESIQVTKDNAGNETVTSVTGTNWAATTGTTGATGAATAAQDLAVVDWTAK